MFDGVCEIRRVLVTEDGSAQLDLRSAPTFEWSWFLSSPERGREMLAVGLTAIACNKLVACVIDDHTVPFARVLKLGLIK